MLFMAVFHAGAEGLGSAVPARWQHGPTPGVDVVGGWVSAAAWGNTGEGQGSGRTFIVFEAETPNQVGNFANYLHLVYSHIEVWPVFDYLPLLKAYEARDPEQFGLPGAPEEQTRRQRELARQYMAAPNPVEAVRIWQESPEATLAVETARVRQEDGSW